MRRTLIFALTISALSLSSAPAVDADTSTAVVTISEVYGGGGSPGATHRNDFVELFNRTQQPIDITGWKLAYSPAANTSWASVTLTGSIPAYHYFLAGFASGGSAGAALPRPDAWGSVNLARAAGEVLLVSRSGRVDLVGYGSSADIYEGRPAPAATTNAQSVTRLPSACSDTNRNDIDFRLRTPSPRNRASYGYICGM